MLDGAGTDPLLGTTGGGVLAMEESSSSFTDSTGGNFLKGVAVRPAPAGVVMTLSTGVIIFTLWGVTSSPGPKFTCFRRLVACSSFGEGGLCSS